MDSRSPLGRRMQRSEALSARPMMRSRSNLSIRRARRRWPWVSWWYSLITVVAVVLILADWWLGFSPTEWFSDKPVDVSLIVTVTDAEGGQPIEGAIVQAGETSATTDAAGTARLLVSKLPVTVVVSRDGFEPVHGEFDESHDREQTVALKRQVPAAPTEIDPPSGDSNSENPRSEDTSEETASQATAEAVTAQTEATPTPSNSGDSEPEGVTLAGVVTDQEGNPIRDALVRINDARTRTRRNGTFRFRGVEPEGTLKVSAAGYAKTELTLNGESEVNVAMEREDIKAVYLTGPNAADRSVVDYLIDLIETTELNAIVIDIKEVYVWYDTDVEFFHEANAVSPMYDPRELVQELHDRGIYVIARMVVFNDPIVAENRPDLAVKTEDGDIWRGWMDDAWVNPFYQELWQANIDLAVEAAEIGFDEIQYDYIRFPSDGDLTIADFGPDYTEEGRVGAIVEFLKQSRKALEPTGAMFAVDVFGIIAIAYDDQGIGQRIADFAPHVDYLCPMVYPSHFDASSIDVGGEPNDFPYETISISLSLAKERMPKGMELKLRPWLQDFDQPPFRDYTPEDVRAQIRASEELGTSGWMLWNAANVFTEEALIKE